MRLAGRLHLQRERLCIRLYIRIVIFDLAERADVASERQVGEG